MNILIIDSEPLSLDFAMRCQEAGHSVKMFFSPKEKHQKVGRGFVPRVADWKPHMVWADLIFMSDNTYAMEDIESFRERGFPIFGCNVAAAKWELQRGEGQAIFRAAGLPVIPGQTFSRGEDAEAYVLKNMKRYVSKPDGDAAKELSYVSKSPQDMIYMLRRWKERKQLKDKFILQDFIPGFEMGVGGWFGEDGFSAALCENWEFKKLCNDDLGVATGEMGTVLRYTEKSQLAEEVLHPLVPYLHAIGYEGYCDVNCIITKDGTPYPLEFTLRPGWPLFNIQQQLHRGDPVKWMVDKLEGRDTLRVSDEIAVGVVVAIPDFPYCSYTSAECEGVPIYGWSPRNRRRIAFNFCSMGKAPLEQEGKVSEAPLPVSAGNYLLTCSNVGGTVEEAKLAAYGVIKQLEIPNSIIYRTDIGCRLEKQLPLLQGLGYAKGMKY